MASRALPGPWYSSGVRKKCEIDGHRHDCLVVGPEKPGWIIAIPIEDTKPRESGPSAFSDARFVAEWNPAEALSVCAYILGLEARNRELEEGLRPFAFAMTDMDRERMALWETPPETARIPHEFTVAQYEAARALLPDPKAGE